MSGLFESAERLGASTFVLVVLLAGIAYSAYWIAQNCLKPLVEAAVGYLQSQADAAQKTAQTVAAIAAIEGEIRGSVGELGRLHVDPDSPFSTIHTNAAIHLVALAVERVANEMGVDVKSLVDELSETLAKQAGSRVSTLRGA